MSFKQRAARPVSPMDSAALVRGAQRGDRQAFAQLYESYTGMVHSIALGQMPIDDADDAVQEVFLRALEKIRTLRDPQAFGGWLGKIAKNTVLNMLQRARSLSNVAEEDVPIANRQDDAIESRRALRAVRSLPSTYRDTLMMRLVYGMSGPEIAARTGMTPASVRVNLHRGMKLLRDRLEPVRTRKSA